MGASPLILGSGIINSWDTFHESEKKRPLLWSVGINIFTLPIHSFVTFVSTDIFCSVLSFVLGILYLSLGSFVMAGLGSKRSSVFVFCLTTCRGADGWFCLGWWGALWVFAFKRCKGFVQ
ncbi:hypothetical protein EDC01DRAFT_55614 [Geopyxis carbonaria]|nr:hypothetical protein EDC01DRAFT_55614 [Geopyxis carbonaria]